MKQIQLWSPWREAGQQEFIQGNRSLLDLLDLSVASETINHGAEQPCGWMGVEGNSSAVAPFFSGWENGGVGGLLPYALALASLYHMPPSRDLTPRPYRWIGDGYPLGLPPQSLPDISVNPQSNDGV